MARMCWPSLEPGGPARLRLLLCEFLDCDQVHTEGIPQHSRLGPGECHPAEVHGYHACHVGRGSIAALFEAASVLERSHGMGQGELDIVKGPIGCERHQAALMGHLQEPSKPHERLALDEYHMLLGYPLRRVLRRRHLWLYWYRLCRGSRCSHLAVVRPVGVLGQFALHECRRPLVQACGNPVLAPVARRLRIVLARARTVDEVIHDLAVAL